MLWKNKTKNTGGGGAHGLTLSPFLSRKENTNHRTTIVSLLNHERRKCRAEGTSRKSEEFMIYYAT